MTEENTYNGWTNYETWAVALWLDNEQSTYNEIRDIVKCNKGKEAWQIGDLIKEYVEDMPEIASVQSKATLAADLISSAISECDFREIAQHLVDEA